MKKFALSLLLTLTAGVPAMNIGCSSGGGSGNPGTGGAGGGVDLTPSPDGFIDGTNAVAILGAWYSYGDWYGGTPTMAGNGDCPVKGMYTVDQCSAITTPTPGLPFTNTAGSMCTSGVGAKVIDMNYSAIWGAGIGFDMNNGGNDGGTGKNPYDAPMHNVTGFAFHIDMPPTGGQMRVEFPTNAALGTTDINSAYWAGETANLSPITKGGDYSFHWKDVGGPMYLTPHMAFDNTKILSMQFHVVTGTSSTIPFTYCISNVRALQD